MNSKCRRWLIFAGLFISTAALFGQSFESSEPRTTPGSDIVSDSAKQSSSRLVSEDTPDYFHNALLNLPRHLFHDQVGMWTSPLNLKLSDATWLVPLGGFTAALFATDTTVSRNLSNTPSTLRRYRHISDYGVYSSAAGAGALYLLGLATDNEHQRETGFLSGESAIDSLMVVEGLKYVTGRLRPKQGNGTGAFGRGGASFPSEHSAVAWAIASTLAHEYPSPFMKFLSYGTATVISASRITGKEHFPSDVVVGAALGYLSSEYVYRHHHDENLQGESWETPALRPDRPSHWQAKNMGSPYVSLDSWIYAAMERLTALGYIQSGFADMRPWTRMECARQTEEAAERVEGNEEANLEAASLFNTLQTEFSAEMNALGGGDNADLRLESVYTRATEIAGRPLTDGDHFGQTIINDYGRPEQQGFNNISGMSGWAADGPFSVYARGEFQHSPSAPSLPTAALDAISYADFGHSTVSPPYPVPPDTPTTAYDEGRFLDAYAAMNLSDWQLSYGNQSLWWGPSQGGPLMFSNNAAPIRMFRVNRVTPFTLPSFLGILGPIRLEAFIGQFSGYEFVLTPTGLVGQYGESLNPQPTIHGERISLKPTENLEVGISRTTDYGGPGYPLTIHTFLRSLLSTGNTGPGAVNKPGSRRAGLDFSYRIPGMRNGMTFYAEGMAEHDEISPLLGPDVAAWLAGIYIPRLPRIPKLDFRVEAGYTTPPSSAVDVNYGAFYWDATWITGFQNNKHLMGSWMGRQGQGTQAWATYWLTPRNKIQFGFRHQEISRELIASGGTLADAGVRTEFWPRSTFSLSASLQYELWNYPVLASTRRSNVTTSIQLSLWPKSWRNKHDAAE
jgi:hypothetical protein